MTVRLRPRQVLCSKCKGVCNENSENVSRKRKPPENVLAPPAKRGLNAPVTRSVSIHTELTKKKLGEATLVPKLTRLTPQEEKDAMNGKIFKKPLTAVSENTQKHSSDSDSDESDTGRRILRKKRSVGSMEDLWDESVFEEANKNNNVNTRTIKISYGPQGEGTVLKIPAQIENLKEEENEDNKAARKALKKAKKEARRKVFLTLGGSSPRYTVGSASPRHGLGNNSPRYMCPDLSLPRRRKHKMKHKKKHKEDRKHREGEVRGQ